MAARLLGACWLRLRLVCSSLDGDYGSVRILLGLLGQRLAAGQGVQTVRRRRRRGGCRGTPPL